MYPPARHSEVIERLARIETKLDEMIGARSDHETRIRKLEFKSHWLSGAAAVVGALFGIGASHLPKL
jgi:hypothetical protein